jgi:hypothetical protein
VFRIGTLVFLTNTALQDEIGIGTVLNVIRSDSDLPDFTLYDVDFASGLQTLHGAELRPVPISISSCGEKEHLLVTHKKAFDIYLRGVRELANAVGVMAHAEFEFLHNRVRAARQALVGIREQLNDHTANHGC